IIMENVPPPNNNPNVLKEEPILDQAPAALVGFAPQWIGWQIPEKNNCWLEEDPEEEPEEEEIEDEDMVNGEEEDDAEVINLYEKVDPHNRPPSTSDEETEFAPPVVQIADADDVPIPPVIQFGSNFHVRESSATKDLLAGNSEVYEHGPMCCDLKSVHRGVKRLSKMMHDRYRTEKKMARKLRQDELRMNGQEFDITALDLAVRENRSKNSKMEEPSIYTALVLRADNPYVMVRDAAMDTRGDEDVDTDAPWDTHPSETRGSPRDSRFVLRMNHASKKKIPNQPQPTLTQEAVGQLVRDGIKATIRAERERVRIEATRDRGPAGGPVAAPMAWESSFARFMKCGPTQFHETEGAVGHVRWIEKIENTFEISECPEGKKVKFATATLHGRTLTWWNSQVATLGREVANGRPWAEVKQMMTDEFSAYIERFNELALLCPDAIPNEKKKVELYIKELPEIIKGETTSSRLATFNEAVRMAHALMEQKIQAKNERIAKGLKRKWENNNQGHKAKDCQSKNVASGATVQSNIVCYECAKRGHKSRACLKKANRRGGNMHGQAYVIRDAEHNQGPNVVTGMFLLYNRYATMLFDSGADKSFVDIKFSHLIDIKPIKLNSSYKVKLADEKVVSTNSVLRGCTLNLLDHLFDIDLMSIELDTFNVIVGMDWLVERDALIVYGKKEVHVPYKNKTLPPPRHVEFITELILNVAPIARAPYRLAPSKLKELSDQLKELSEKGHVIDSNGVHVDPEKLEAIQNWSAPTTPTEGMEEEEAFQTLKQKLCSTPILALPEGTKNFNVYYDALLKGFRAVLMQREMTNNIEKLSQQYLKKIVCKHGVPVSIISDRDSLLTSRFWKTLQEALGTQLNLSTAYHLETDGQSERMIQTLEDMLRACVIDFGNICDRHLPLVEISYNNGYHASIKAAPFEALYGRKLDDMAMLKVSPWKGVICFRKCDENLVIPLEEIQLDDKLHFIKELVEIMDREVKQLKQSQIPNVKVRWNSRRGLEYT
nr:hypothetical protein [Tanacetum cinerariifolium]